MLNMSDTLEVTKPSPCEVMISRVFDAPPQRVFACYTKPELVSRWMLGPEGWTMPVCEIDLTVGGTYRYEWKGPNDGHLAMTGVFHEIVVPEKLVATERFDADEMEEARVTTLFKARGTKTVVEMTVLFGSEEARDAAVATGMADGMEAGHKRLDAILAAEEA